MLSTTVVICAYCDERRRQLDDAIRSVLDQTRRPDRVVVVIDHNQGLLLDIRAAFADISVVANTGKPGLSGARNTGIRHSGTDIVAFLDDDAVADPDWLERLAAHYADAAVIGVGGKVTPLWQAGRPRWFPEEFQWVVGCSYRGLPDALRPVRNPIGCNMSFRRQVFASFGGFREGIGRTGQDGAGCEETELCIRLRQQMPGSHILYDPAAVVHHHVTAGRSRWTYFRRRCLAEGRSKSAVVRAIGSGDELGAEQVYVRRILPAGILRGLFDTAVRLDPWGLLRALGIVAGLAFTTAGYASAKFSGGRRLA